MRGTWLLAAALVAVSACNLVKTKRPSDPGGPGAPRPDPSADDGVAGPRRPTEPLDEDKLDLASDVLDYARFCKQELGLPTAPLAPWNCLDGHEVPVTVDGKKPTASVYADLAAGRAGCDRPSWLGDAPCGSYGFVQQRELAPDVHAVLLCRMRAFSSPLTRDERRAAYEASGRFADFRALYDFDSLGLIWTNVKTGKTCFFDFVGKLYGGYVASPDDPRRPAFEDLPAPRPPAEMAPGTPLEGAWRKNGRDTWKAPAEVVESDDCQLCHDSGPFVVSPWVQAVMTLPRLHHGAAYRVVGKVFDPWRKDRPAVSVSTTPVVGPSGQPEPQLCTRCHKMGSQNTCALHFEYAIGAKAPAKRSKTGEAFVHRAWMPPMPEAWKAKPEAEQKRLWDEAYGAHVRKMACCCKTPSARGCTTQALDVTPLPEPVEGTGPESCE